jgi:type II secretory pathway pseudopilin PulG
VRTHHRLHAGFTLVELLGVIGIIILLIGVTIPVALTLRRGQQTTATKHMVDVVALAMRQYGRDVWWVPAANANIRLWDWNRDGILDGDPLQETVLPGSPSPLQVVDAGYAGVADLVGLDVPRSCFDPKTRRITDVWRQPLQIAFASKIYGEDAWGVWSPGPIGSGRPLTSWER